MRVSVRARCAATVDDQARYRWLARHVIPHEGEVRSWLLRHVRTLSRADADITICHGINHDDYDPEVYRVISAAS